MTGLDLNSHIAAIVKFLDINWITGLQAEGLLAEFCVAREKRVRHGFIRAYRSQFADGQVERGGGSGQIRLLTQGVIQIQ